MTHTEFSWKNGQEQKIFAQDWQPTGDVHGAVGLVHGLGEHSGRYAHVARLLNQAGYALTGFDLPGHGKSAGKRGHASYAEILTEIDCLLHAMQQRYADKPMFLYGHSLGGALTLYYTLQRKPAIAGIVVSSPGLAPGGSVPAAKRRMAQVMARLAPSFTMKNGLDLHNLSHDPAVIDAYTQDPLVHPYISARLGWDLMTLGEWIQQHAAELSIPLLLYRGTGDQLVSAQAIQSFVQAVPPQLLTYQEWDGLYHETHNEREQEKVIQAMIDWLNMHTV